MLLIKLDPDTERQVAELARRNGVSLDALMRQAVERLLEDHEDLAAVDAAMQDYDPSTNVPLADVKRRLGLED